MKKLLLLPLLFMLYSCEEDIQGDLHTTWLFWFILLVFVLLIVFSVRSGNAQSKMDNDKMVKNGINPENL